MKKKILVLSLVTALAFAACVKTPPAESVTEPHSSDIEADTAENTDTGTETYAGTGVDADDAVQYSFDSFNITGLPLEGREDEPNYIGSYETPFITGVSDMEFFDLMIDTFEEQIITPADEFGEEYNSLRGEMKAAAEANNADLAEGLQNVLKNVTYTGKLDLIAISNDYIALTNTISYYIGGAHDTIEIHPYNIDFKNSKFLTLGDLFDTDGYKDALLNTINEQIKNSPETQALLFPEQPVIGTISDKNFFISGGKLFIYYAPYEIGPFSSGFIHFSIPLADLDGLKDEYLNLDVQDVTLGDGFFEFLKASPEESLSGEVPENNR